MINYHIKYITSSETLHLKSSDFKCFKYETKKRAEESIYGSSKRNYCELRGGHWRSPRPRQIQKLESKLRDKNVIACEWTNEQLVTIIFSSGVIAYLTVKQDTLDISQILFDRYFVGKLPGHTVTNVVLSKSHILFTFVDRIATLVTFKKKTSNVPCKIVDKEPLLQTIELGGASRRTDRHVSWCENNDLLWTLVWSVTPAEPAPWSPVLEDHANLHLYQISGQNMNLLVYHRLENETLVAELSHKRDRIIHIVDQTASQKNCVTLRWMRYEVTESHTPKLQVSPENVTRLALPAPARVARRAPCDSRLVAACIDGSVHVAHHTAGLTHSTKAGFIATDVRWAGELVIAIEENGRIQCFDRALSLLNHHIKFLDLAADLSDAKRMKVLATLNAKCGPILLATFTGGPLALIHITHPRLITAWIRARRTSSAVALLRAMDWEHEGNDCLWAVNKLICASLRSGAEAVAGEGAAEAALGAWLAPRVPHAHAARRYASPLHDLARKFFHHLLRRGRVEKALSLGVELAAWDLFRDARWAAARRAPRLQHEAELLARALRPRHCTDSECSESCSCSSCSNSDDDTSASSETKPPPLPRVALPDHSTLLPVPASQPEPSSTNSIRPNLHQYLERDSTIWHRAIQDDTYLKTPSADRLKPILSQSSKWHSVEGLATHRPPTKHSLAAISEGTVMPSRSVIDIVPRPYDERIAMSHFKHLYQTELKEEAPNTLYRYQNNNYQPSLNYALEDRAYSNNVQRTVNRTEKNKVKFSDTVTIAVMSDPPGSPDSARELADSLPLCPPHNYLSAFTPQTPEAAPQKPSKIKVVHFGMV
ncbi:WD repeat-containing and planar cell polarity effector protein fritz isoform X2 [Bombyx mori]|uniref:WD repeat-containing and planar cell polarity effector protein fritz n=1 Tax=Bombyx mori TaxID=7091 RepID=A0A8R2AH98_BOMMO|nr:WD repeat-containing and planar cell polarity effector protein fritz isoform X2 [Bombyx mori]